MRFPAAYKGVKKIFIAELFIILASLMLIVSAVLAKLPAASEEGSPLPLVVLTLAGVAGIIAIVCFIIQMIGYHQGGKDEPYFRVAFYLVILAIVTNVLSTSFNSSISGKSLYVSIYSMTGDLISLFAIYTFVGHLDESKQVNNAMVEFIKMTYKRVYGK